MSKIDKHNEKTWLNLMNWFNWVSNSNLTLYHLFNQVLKSFFQSVMYKKVMVKAQCLWDVAVKMNLSIDSTKYVLVANLKPLYWAQWPR